MDNTTLVYGKIPPQAVELEEVVLGAILLERGTLETVMQILPGPEAFYADANQKIYQACIDVLARGEHLDLLTAAEALRRSNELEIVGGAYYLTRLTMNVVTNAHVESHARIVLEKYIAREVIRCGGAMVQDGYEDSTDALALLQEAEEAIFNLRSFGIRKEPQTMAQAVMATSAKMDQEREHKSHITGVPTGFKEIDECTGGWQKTDLIIVAARPSVGKTAFALNLMYNAATHAELPKPGMFFSLEMSTGDLVKRMLSSISGVPLKRLRRPGMQSDEDRVLITEAQIALARLNLHIDDTAALTVPELRTKARRAKLKYDIQFIVIDYLQLMKGNTQARGNREQEISQISRDLKELAKELEIPIIALSQMSRAVEQRGSNEPQLSDLRESGALEQDADLVIFLWRPSKQDLQDSPHLAGCGRAYLKKHRNGETNDFLLQASLDTQLWHDIAPAAFRSMAEAISRKKAAEVPGSDIGSGIPTGDPNYDPSNESADDLPF